MKFIDLRLLFFFLFSMICSNGFAQKALVVPVSSLCGTNFVLKEAIVFGIQKIRVSYLSYGESLDGLSETQKFKITTSVGDNINRPTVLAMKAKAIFGELTRLCLTEEQSQMESQVFLRVTSKELDTLIRNDPPDLTLCASGVAMELATKEAETLPPPDQCLGNLTQSHFEEIETTTQHSDWNEPKQLHCFICQLTRVSMIRVELSKELGTIITVLAYLTPRGKRTEPEETMPTLFEMHYRDKGSECISSQALEHLSMLVPNLYGSNQRNLALRSCLIPKECPFGTLSRDHYPIHLVSGPIIGNYQSIRFMRQKMLCIVPPEIKKLWTKKL